MGDALFFGVSINSDISYNWNAAFNNDEFLEYLTNNAYPSNYTGYEEEIFNYDYYGITKFVSVLFPNCYKSVGSHAFENCYNLQSALIVSTKYEGYTYEIGDYAFANCSNLVSFRAVTPRKIGKRAFYNCSKLSYVFLYNILNSDYSATYWLNDIDDEAFMNCTYPGLSTANMIYVNRIGKRTFANCKFSTYYTPSVGISICRKIDDEAFLNCSTIYSLSFNMYPVSSYRSGIICELGSDIFKGCTSLKQLQFGCVSKISSTTFGSDIKSTLQSIFVTMHESLESWYFDAYTDIGSHAFEDYAVLKTAYVSRLTNIGDYAFNRCSKMIEFYISKYSPCSRIGAYAFANCTSMSFININNSAIAYIGSHAFENCSNLSRVNMYYLSSVPNLESIDAFYNTKSDYGILIPPSLYQDFVNDPVWGLISSHFVT